MPKGKPARVKIRHVVILSEHPDDWPSNPTHIVGARLAGHGDKALVVGYVGDDPAGPAYLIEEEVTLHLPDVET